MSQPKFRDLKYRAAVCPNRRGCYFYRGIVLIFMQLMETSTFKYHEEEASSNEDEMFLDKASTDSVLAKQVLSRPAKTTKNKRSHPKAQNSDAGSLPRRPLSAYNYFFKAERIKILGEIRKEQEGRTIQDIKAAGQKSANFQLLAKTVAERWKKLPAEEAEKYNLLSRQDRERYQRELDHCHAVLAQQPPRRSTPEDPSNSNDAFFSEGGPTNLAAFGTKVAPSSQGNGDNIRDAVCMSLRTSSAADKDNTPAAAAVWSSNKRAKLEEVASLGAAPGHSSKTNCETTFPVQLGRKGPHPSACLDSTQNLLLQQLSCQHRQDESLMAASAAQASSSSLATLVPDSLLSRYAPNIFSTEHHERPIRSTTMHEPAVSSSSMQHGGLNLLRALRNEQYQQQILGLLLEREKRILSAFIGPTINAEQHHGGHADVPSFASGPRPELSVVSRNSEYFMELSNTEVARHQQNIAFDPMTPTEQLLALINESRRQQFPIGYYGNPHPSALLPGAYHQGPFQSSSVLASQPFGGQNIDGSLEGDCIPSLNSSIHRGNTQSLLHDLLLRKLFGQGPP